MTIENGRNLNFAILVAEIDKINTNSPMTVAEIYAYNYGEHETLTIDESKWTEIICAVNTDNEHEFVASLPEIMLDSIEINDEGTGSSYSYETETTYFIVGFDMYKGDYSEIEDEEFIDIISEHFSNDFPSDYSIGNEESDSATINDKYWRIYAVEGNSDNEVTDTYMLFYADENVLCYVYTVSVVGYTDTKDNDIAEMYDLAVRIVRSLEIN